MYNYVIIQSEYDYFRVTYKDAIDSRNVVYMDQFPRRGGGVIRWFYRVHYSPKINKIISLPFKSKWFPIICRNIKFETSRPICFIFSDIKAYWASNNGFIEYLTHRYNNAKFVCIFQDLVETMQHINIQQIKEKFDAVISYDKFDAGKFGLYYHPTIFSKITFKLSDYRESDVYFVGAAKNRLSCILKYYDILTANGLNCNFFITGMSLSYDPNRPGIRYIDKMSYLDNLKNVMGTKAILEVMQSGAVGYTLRTWEAISYKKYLITNNSGVSRFLLNNSDGIILGDDISLVTKESIAEEPWYSEELFRMFNWCDFTCYLNSILN